MIIPGIFEKDKSQLLSKIRILESFMDFIQIDLADGVLVSGKTFTQRNLFEQMNTRAKFQLHFMMEKPLFYLEVHLPSVTSVCTQIEAPVPPRRFINMAKNLGYKVGLSLNPETPFFRIEPYIEMLDFVQFMTVSPGAQGRDFKSAVLNKMQRFKAKYPNMRIQADGGINERTLPFVLDSGADDVIIGSALFRGGNPLQVLRNLQEIGA